MKPLQVSGSKVPIRFDDPEMAMERACQDERANWIAGRVGLPTIGSKLVNKHGIEWVVQNHATVPTANTLHRWRGGSVKPELDMYPVIAPQNFSPKLGDEIKSCASNNRGGFPTVCQTISADCATAAGVCACIAQFKCDPPNYILGLHVCWVFKWDIEGCLEDLGLGIKGLQLPRHDPPMPPWIG